MAIVNSIAFGKSRKSAGNVVFYDRLGQTIARQKNLTPTNPNTSAQVSRRILITNPSRLYRAVVEGTRAGFGSKFFDYSFGRSYLATKRRTAYNEFFVRAMAMPAPAFMSKQDVLNRRLGYPVECEVSQGSLLKPTFYADALAPTNEGQFICPSMTATTVASDIAEALIADYGYPVDGSFKAMILFFVRVVGQNSESLKVESATLSQDSVGTWSLKYTNPRFSVTGILGYLKTSMGLGDPAGEQWIIAGFSFVPFANVGGVLSSANESIHLAPEAASYYDVAMHTTDEGNRDQAIMSYMPSTPTGYVAPAPEP